MAERVVFVVLQMLADPLIRESLLLYGVRDEVEWLQKELRWMESFLVDAEAKRRRGDELVNNWLREVREVAHEAEDIIDAFTLEIESTSKTREKKEKKRGLLRRIKRYAAFPCKLISRHKVGTEIKGLKAKIDNIEKSRVRYGLVNLTTETTPLADETLQARRRIYPHLDHSTLVVGLDLHTKEIADRLLDPAIKRRSVVSIVGIGGLGKTTLANKVYNHSDIKARFHVSACISVSQDYKVHEILKGLVNQLMGKTMAELQSSAEFELSKMLPEYLMQRRYLIVLDDVWEKAVWDDLKRAALPEVNNGSRVLLTTRLLDLANSIDPMPYELPFLNEDESWALFLNKAFPFRDFSEPITCPEDLEGISRRLVRRCGGLPLALEVLGGIFSSKQPNSVAWKSVAEHFDWSSTEGGGNCSKILGLSYDNLPHHHLKSCFLYLGVFPEDSVIKAQQLIELWIAEGFIPQLETQLMEDTARTYLEELAERSMIQVVDKDWLGSSASVMTLRIHDLFRDLCIREARENGFFNIYNLTTSNSTTTGTLQDTINIHGKNLRRLVVHGGISTSVDFTPPRNLKSILQFGTTGENHTAITIPNGLKLVRVIHFAGTNNENDEKFPEMFDKMIMNMRHLRYLRLSDGRSNIEFLPPSIRNLCNLQTLELSTGDVSVLPDWLGEMGTLRHLYFINKNSFIIVSCLADVGSLTNLQTLDVKIDTRAGGWMESGLEKLVNIRNLKVTYLREEQGGVFIDSLRKMKHLSYLVVEEGVIPIEILSGLSENTHLRYLELWGGMSLSVQQLPESLHGFPPNLTTLILGISELVKDPMATLEKLPYLRLLNLSYNSYIGKKMVCTSGGFPRLRKLQLTGLKALEEVRLEDGAMPNLTVLEIKNCSNLRMLPEGLQHLRSLRTLHLWGFLRKHRVRREVGDDWYKIQHVPQIKLDGMLI